MRADTERSGRISADQFAEIFLPSATPAAAAAATDATAVASPPPPPRGGALVRAESFSAEDARVNPQRALRRLFTLLDTDGNGWLNCASERAPAGRWTRSALSPPNPPRSQTGSSSSG